jgi:PAS domain S-box-containing protein
MSTRKNRYLKTPSDLIVQKRLFLYFSLIVLLSSVLFGTLACFYILSLMQDTIEKSSSNEMKTIDFTIHSLLSHVEDDTRYLSTQPVVMGADSTLINFLDAPEETSEIAIMKEVPGRTGEIYDLYENYARTHPDVAYVYMGSIWGGYVQWPDRDLAVRYDPRVRPYYQQAIEKPGEVILSPPYQTYGSRFNESGVIISTSTTIRSDNGSVIGVQGIDISLHKLSDLISTVRILDQGYIFLYLADGRILAHPDKNLTFLNISSLTPEYSQTSSDSGSNSPLNETYTISDPSVLLNNPDGLYELTVNGQRVIVNIHTSSETGWRMAAVIERAYLEKTSCFVAIVLFLLGSLVTLLSMIVARIISRQFATFIRNAGSELLESEDRLRTLINTMADIVCFKDSEGKWLVANDFSLRLFHLTDQDYVGRTDSELALISPSFGKIFHMLGDLDKQTWFSHSLTRGDQEIILPDGTRMIFDLITIPLYSQEGERVGMTVVGRDITERKKSEEALRKANRQVNLLTTITRHDILNKISVIRGYLAVAEMESSDPNLSEYLERMKSATNFIQSQIEFTRIYQDLGLHEPQWQELDTIMPSSTVPASITLNANLKGVSVFADPMVEKVFSNLLDNSVRHGEQVTEIMVSAHESGNTLIIIWEDNGVGIPDTEKDLIFVRGYGKNTGLGMFLVREILLLTDITIQETGLQGKGARFEIRVQKGGYRLDVPDNQEPLY